MTGDQVCKCCGQTLPIVLGFKLRLSDGQKRIVEAVRKAGRHGIATDRLFEAVYADDIDGGPESGTKTLHVRICKINKTLGEHGWRIGGQNTGTRHAYGRYTLFRTDEVRDAAE